MTKILIVEDESIVAWDIKETLEKLGHQVVDLVVSGAEAIQSVTTSHPELVLMDIRLAGAMDGIAAAEEIYDRFKIPVVYLTAHADDRTLARATQTNPFGYIIKPFRSQTLQSTIQVAIQRHQREASAQIDRSGLEHTLNSFGSGIIITDRQGLVTFINRIAEALTGWESTAAIGLQIGQVFRLIWETDGIAIENPSLRAMRLKQSVKSPDRCWLTTKDNSQIPICDTASPIIQPDDEIVGSIVVFQDNSERLSAHMDLWERNQDLEFFQLKLISQLQVKSAAYQQAIACIQVLDLILSKVSTVHSEDELLGIAIEQLGVALDADYCWVTRHDRPDNTAKIIYEFINRDTQADRPSNIGKQIDIRLYPQYYKHLFNLETAIDPPLDIIPYQYLDRLTPTDRILIYPVCLDPPESECRSAQLSCNIGEVGIVTTGKPLWTSDQIHLITQILNYAVKLFWQAQLVESIVPEAIDDRD
jgi:PAS domain S-box-containing protein